MHRHHQWPAETGERAVAGCLASGQPSRRIVNRLFELWYEVAKSQRVAANRERLSVFMAKLEALAFDDRDAEAAGAIRAQLERAGRPIGAYDTLMAGQALRRGMTLVTANVAEFGRVAGLRWENWAAE